MNHSSLFFTKKDTPARLARVEEFSVDAHSIFYGAMSVAAIMLFIFINLGGF